MASPGTAQWAREVGYGPGWPSCADQAARLTAVEAFGRKMAWNRRAKRALRYLNRTFRSETPAYHELISKSADVGSYNCRPIAGTSVASNHSFGTSVDLRWHANARDGDRSSEMRDRGMPAVRKVRHDGIFRWGGDYSSPDDMHFEVIKTPAELRKMLTWRGKLRRRYR